MKKHYNHDEEIERTLQSLEGIQQAKPSPFFYTRLQARMSRKQAGNGVLFMLMQHWGWFCYLILQRFIRLPTHPLKIHLLLTVLPMSMD
jgi:hypothetical protein